MNNAEENKPQLDLRQQTALAQFGELALRSDNLDDILTEACRLAGLALGTHLAKVMELQDDGHTLLVRAGIGWKPGVVGKVTIQATDETSEGHALRTGEPMISPDIAKETRFKYPPFLIDNGVRAVANVLIIGAQGKPYFGVLQVDSRTPRQFTASDTAFLRSYANLIAATVDRLRVLESVRDDQARLRLALETGELGTWELDVADGKSAHSLRHDQIFGYAEPPLDWTYSIAISHIVPEDRAAVQRSYRKALDAATDWTFQCRIRRAGDGAIRWVEVHARPVGTKGNRPTHLMGIVADITERKQLEHALQHSNDVLEARVADRTHALTVANGLLQSEGAERSRVEEVLRHAQKMEAVGQLTGGLAHDFNNLLTGMSGNLELMRGHLVKGRTTDLDRYITSAMVAVKRAAAVTHRLLAFSRRQRLDPKPTDVNRLVGGLEELVRRTVGPDIRIEYKISVDLWPTQCDRNQLENALLNLVINARDAMPLPKGGDLVIATANIIIPAGQRTPGQPDDVAAGEYVTVAVKDTGTGMTPDVIARAFEPFFTTKPVGKGSGLGLSMIYGFVKQSGGHVLLRSENGGGTTVTVYLPRHFGTVTTEKTESAPTERQPAAAHGAVLLVEDDVEVRMVMCETLSDRGYTVLEAADGQSGLRIVESAAVIDLLLTDVGLPGGMNGRQLADAARQLRRDLKVLFVTGYADRADFANNRMEQGMELMSKPFALDALAARVQDMIGDSPLVDALTD